MLGIIQSVDLLSLSLLSNKSNKLENKFTYGGIQKLSDQEREVLPQDSPLILFWSNFDHLYFFGTKKSIL